MRAGSPLTTEAIALRGEIDGNLVALALTPKMLAKAGKDQLFVLQKAAMLGCEWGVIDTPAALQAARIRAPLNLWTYLPAGVSRKSAQAQRIILELMRLAIAQAMFPSRTGILMRHTTIRSVMDAIARIIRDFPAIGQRGPFWPVITIADVAALSPSYVPPMAVLHHYHVMGAIADTATGRPRVSGTEGPRDRTGEPEHTQVARSPSALRPYSNELVSAAGWAAIVMIRVIGPTLLDAVDAASRVTVRDKKVKGKGNISVGNQYAVKAEALDPIIADWKWRGPDGRKLKTIPIEITLKQGTHSEPLSWPPKTFHHALLLLSVLQSAHAFPLALSMGPRDGEMVSMKVGMLKLVPSSGPVGSFHTWKMKPAGGRETEAPIPTLVVEAIVQQERMARILKKHYKVVNDNLWVSIRHPDQLPRFCHSMNWFFQVVGVGHLVTDGGASVHRFRKTLARIVALALVHAPKILMDVFGHRDEEITIVKYILADPAFLAEVQTVVREMVILIAADAVTNVDHVQGAGAPGFHERVSEYAKRAGESALEPTSPRFQ